MLIIHAEDHHRISQSLQGVSNVSADHREKIDEFAVLSYPMVLSKQQQTDHRDHAKQKIYRCKKNNFRIRTSKRMGPVFFTSVNRFRISEGMISC